MKLCDRSGKDSFRRDGPDEKGSGRLYEITNELLTPTNYQTMKTCIFTSVLIVMMLMRRKHFTAVS